MAKIVKNALANFLVICLIFLMMVGWIFSGWPQIWQNPSIPPKIQEVRAATERQSPDVIIIQTNLSGVIADIQDDPDSPDGSWLTTTASNSTLRVSYLTPTGNPRTGADLQNFRLWLRKDAAGGGDPICTLEVYENGSLHQSISTGNIITSDTGQILAGTWDASGLTNSDGSGVELRLVSTKGGGGPNERNIEVGAVEWNVDYTTGPSITAPANVQMPDYTIGGAGYSDRNFNDVSALVQVTASTGFTVTVSSTNLTGTSNTISNSDVNLKTDGAVSTDPTIITNCSGFSGITETSSGEYSLDSSRTIVTTSSGSGTCDIYPTIRVYIDNFNIYVEEDTGVLTFTVTSP